MFPSAFDGKIALLTASTSGIGLATAKLFAAGGARAVYVNGRDASAGARAVAEIMGTAPGAHAEFVAGDLSDAPQAARVCDTVLQKQGRVDILLHAGGAEISPKLFVDLDPAHYRQLIDGHFTSLLYCASVVVPAMVRQGAGAVVAIASDAGKIATPGETLIGSMKAAVIMYVRTLSLEVSRHGVRVNCVTPSLVAKTKAYDRVMASEFSRRLFEKAAARARLGVPTPDDIAPLAAFLASSFASHISGQAISVNGGISA
jgi:3-oxoacyl-[acyl-carrier protein] reductase